MSVIDAPRPPALERPVSSTRGGRIPAVIAVVAVLAGLIVSPPWDTRAGVPAGFAGRLLSGDLERGTADRWVGVGIGELVPEGATVRSADGAELEVRGGRVALADATVVTLGDASTLEAGSLLTDVPGGQRTVRIGSLVATGRGIWRVDRAAIDRVAVYTGGTGVTVDGSDDGGLSLGRFDEADLGGNQLPAMVLPIDYSASDPWDARLLAGLIATDRAAAQLERSFTGRYGTAAQPASFYLAFEVFDETLAASLDRIGGVEAAERVGPPADVLLAAVVIDLLADRAGLTTADALDEVVRLRAAGASWGVVLARHDLGADDLREAVDLALRDAPESPVIGTPGPGPAVAIPGDDTAGEPDDGDGTDEPVPPQPSPTRSPSDDPTDGGSEAPGPCQLEPCEPLNDTVDDLTDIVDEVVPGGGEQLDELISEVPTILPPGDAPLVDTVEPLPEPSTIVPSAGDTIGDVVDEASGAVGSTIDRLPALP